VRAEGRGERNGLAAQVHYAFDVKRLPLYDESADIACTITADEIPRRIELVQKMRSAMSGLERTEHGIILSFAPAAETEAVVKRFVVDESRCCRFWGFAIEASSSELSLRWDAPPAAQEIVDRLVAFFEGDEPPSAFGELL
jgi:hypothetical protein